MSSSGEMTVIRNMINKSARTIEKRYGADKDVLMLGEMLEELHKINSVAQPKIMVLVKFKRKRLQSLCLD